MTDLRTSRTRALLRGALLKLLDDKPLQRCTVTEVCALACVSRKAFYSHYKTLEDLAQDCFLCWYVYAGPSGKRLADYGSLEEACLETLEQTARKLLFFKDHPNLAKAMVLGVGVSPYYRLTEKTDTDLNIDHVMTMYGESSPPFSQVIDAASYITAGSFGLMRRWVLEGMTGDMETLVKNMSFFSFQCAAGVVGRPIEPVFAKTVAEWRMPDSRQASA